MSIHECFYSVIDTRAIWHLLAYKLRLPAGMADQDSAPYPPERGENRAKRGERNIKACCTENTVYFHINNIIRVRILRDFLADPQILRVLCHDFLRCVLPCRTRLIANHSPG